MMCHSQRAGQQPYSVDQVYAQRAHKWALVTHQLAYHCELLLNLCQAATDVHSQCSLTSYAVRADLRAKQASVVCACAHVRYSDDHAIMRHTASSNQKQMANRAAIYIKFEQTILPDVPTMCSGPMVSLEYAAGRSRCHIRNADQIHQRLTGRLTYLMTVAGRFARMSLDHRSCHQLHRGLNPVELAMVGRETQAFHSPE
jgi:hypothetical protein